MTINFEIESYHMFYEIEFYEYITFCCLFILISRRGIKFIIILLLSYIVQISIIWDLKNQIRELNGQIVKDKTCKTVKFSLYYFEKEIKFC